jgi:RNA polymerase sigma-70 factor (ECF subfamily)
LRSLDRRAWADAYERHLTAVYGCIVALVIGNRTIAEDLHQQVWLAALESTADFDEGRGDFRAWICGIARRQVAWHYRRQRTAAVVGIEPEFDPADDALLPPDVAEQIELEAQVQAAVATLPDEYRSVLVAKYVEGLSVAAIATAQNRTSKAIESVLTRARERLRKLLLPCGEAPSPRV